MTILEVYISGIQSLINEFKDKYNLNSGGDGMAAILVSEFLDRLGFYPTITACYKDDADINISFGSADHYMVVVAGLEINPPTWEPKRTKNATYHECKEIMYNHDKEYNHIHDLEFLDKLYKISQYDTGTSQNDG